MHSCVHVSIFLAIFHTSGFGFVCSLQYSLCNEPLIELSNPGASGSVFYVTKDDEFIIKTVLHKEAEFLQKLLPGYYMVSSLIVLRFWCFLQGALWYCTISGGGGYWGVVKLLNNFSPCFKMSVKINEQIFSFKKKTILVNGLLKISVMTSFSKQCSQ